MHRSSRVPDPPGHPFSGLHFARDSRTETISAMYPRLDEWRAVRDAVDPERVFASGRLRLVEDRSAVFA
ncbi:D-arabinono-1,4-lactone oxidase [Nocardia aurea]|uniref:D-arabinono-1,4-lactone oxidase n=1 Tax=Nocardia aurea TaxID=2144174 RepID=UPI000D698849